MSEMELLRLTVHLTSLDGILLDSDRLLGVGQSPASVNIPVKLSISIIYRFSKNGFDMSSTLISVLHTAPSSCYQLRMN
jgi:hypothetical protein